MDRPARVLPIRVAPSLLACDFTRLADEIHKVEQAGADWLHVDVMDGHFVPNFTVGPVVVEAIRRESRLPLDVHLMLDHPERYVERFIDAGASLLTVHVEAPGLQEARILRETLDTIRRRGATPGLSVRPKTPAEALRPFADALGLILIMTVEPGFGGQAFMPEVVPKIREVRRWYGSDLAVDGGITEATAGACREAGANAFVAGTYIFHSLSYHDAVQSLRGV